MRCARMKKYGGDGFLVYSFIDSIINQKFGCTDFYANKTVYFYLHNNLECRVSVDVFVFGAP